jgi:hypothetical protein
MKDNIQMLQFQTRKYGGCRGITLDDQECLILAFVRLLVLVTSWLIFFTSVRQRKAVGHGPYHSQI